MIPPELPTSTTSSGVPALAGDTFEGADLDFSPRISQSYAGVRLPDGMIHCRTILALEILFRLRFTMMTPLVFDLIADLVGG